MGKRYDTGASIVAAIEAARLHGNIKRQGPDRAADSTRCRQKRAVIAAAESQPWRGRAKNQARPARWENGIAAGDAAAWKEKTGASDRAQRRSRKLAKSDYDRSEAARIGGRRSQYSSGKT